MVAEQLYPRTEPDQVLVSFAEKLASLETRAREAMKQTTEPGQDRQEMKEALLLELDEIIHSHLTSNAKIRPGALPTSWPARYLGMHILSKEQLDARTWRFSVQFRRTELNIENNDFEVKLQADGWRVAKRFDTEGDKLTSIAFYH
jgi:hypothetical protein